MDKLHLLKSNRPHLKKKGFMTRIFKTLAIILILVLLGISVYIYRDIPKINKHRRIDTTTIVLDKETQWEPIKIEAIGLLTDLIKISTVRKDEDKAMIYLQKFLEKEGISSKLIPNPDKPDKVSLFAEIGPKDSRDGVILLNHLDVVEANKKDWSEDPFSGILKENEIIGRGALDMKGMTTMELMAFVLLKRKNIPLKSRVMFLATPDEEDGGKYGVQFLLKEHEDIFKGYKYVLNEGGFGIQDFPKKGNQVFTIQTAEKGVLGIELTSRGDSAHGSMPDKTSPALQMIKLISDIQTLHKFQLSKQTVEFFHRISKFYDFPQSFFLKRIQNPFVQKIISSKLMEKRTLNASLTNTYSLTQLTTYPESYGKNVISPEVKAYLDIRVLPKEDPSEIFKKIEFMAKKYNILAQMKVSDPPSESSDLTDFFEILYSVLKDNFPEAQVSPYLSPGATDSKFFREKGYECYGLIPILIPLKDVSKLHGTDESISIENLKIGTKIIFETLTGFNQLQSIEQ